MKKNSQNHRSIIEIVSAVISIIFGIFLFIRPELMSDLAVVVFSLVLCAVGIFWLIRYFRTSPIEAAHSSDFAEALLALTVGVAFFFNRPWFEAVVPLIWGLLLIIGAFLILQTAIDFVRLKIRFWWILLLGAAVSFTLGLLSVFTPEFLSLNLPLFVGVSLIIEGIIHIVSMYFLHLSQKEIFSGKRNPFLHRDKLNSSKQEAKTEKDSATNSNGDQ